MPATELVADRPEAVRSPGRVAGTLAAVALVVTWSSGFIGAELGARAGAAPVTLLAWRFVVLAGLLLVVAAVVRMPLPGWHAWARQVLLALLCQVGYLLLVFEGVSRGVGGGTAALIAAVQPMLVATVAGPILGERSSVRTWIGMAIGLAGVVIVVSGDLQSAPVAALVYLLPVAGMVSLTSGTVATRRLRPPETLLQSVVMQAVVSAVAIMGLALVTDRAAPPTDRGFWFAVFWLIAFASLGGYVMYVHITTTRGATVASTLLYLTPPTTMVWVLVMFGEPLTVAGVIGLLVSAVGVVVVVLRAPRRLE